MLRCIARISCLFGLMLAASFRAGTGGNSPLKIVDLQKPGTPTTAKIFFAKDKYFASNHPAANAADVRSSLTLRHNRLRWFVMPRSIWIWRWPAQSPEPSDGHDTNASFPGRRRGECLRRTGKNDRNLRRRAGSCHKVRQ